MGRLFLGDYNVIVSGDGRSNIITVTLSRNSRVDDEDLEQLGNMAQAALNKELRVNSTIELDVGADLASSRGGRARSVVLETTDSIGDMPHISEMIGAIGNAIQKAEALRKREKISVADALEEMTTESWKYDAGDDSDELPEGDAPKPPAKRATPKPLTPDQQLERKVMLARGRLLKKMQPINDFPTAERLVKNVLELPIAERTEDRLLALVTTVIAPLVDKAEIEPKDGQTVVQARAHMKQFCAKQLAEELHTSFGSQTMER